MVEQEKTKTEPHVRFRGFDDEWEEVKLGDEVQRIGTGRSSFVSGISKTNTTPYAVLGSTSIISYDDDFDHSGNFVLTARVGANAGDLYKYSGDVKISDNTVYIQSDNLDFIFNLLTDYNLKRLSFGTGQPLVKMSELKKLTLSFPTKEEQQKIGELFQTLDKVIDLSNTQVENLKQQKKALLQRLFPQKGETAPKVRLRGFTDDWEQVKLGDVFSVYSKKGRTDLPFVTVGERETNERTASAQGYGNDVSDKARAKAKVLLSGQFLIDLSSYGRGIYMSRMDGVTSSAYNVLNLDNGVGSYWVEYLISHDFVESLKRLTPPGARQGKMIEVDGLLKTKTFVPSLEEQQAIGELFQTLDEQIRLAEDKVSQYKELKQALLQRLFV